MRIRSTIAALAAAGALSACGDDAETTTTTVSVPPASTTTVPVQPAPEPEPDPAEPADEPADDNPETGPQESPEEDPRITEIEREAGRAVRSYIGALNDRDAATVCTLLAPGAIDEVELPKPRGDCTSSLAASVGYRDPRGLPVWEGVRVAAVQSIELLDGGASAKVVGTVVTDFADRPDPSIEEDVVYLARSGDRWLVAKPSTTLYRAVGVADVPPSVISPPD